jgi:hypothetical protein
VVIVIIVVILLVVIVLIILVYGNQGLNLCIPVIDSIKYVQSLKEIAIDIPQQSAITAGNDSFI